MKSWKTTISGLAAIIVAGCVSLKYITPDMGVIILGVIAGILGFVSKDNNVHGGTVAQATPPTVQVQTLTEGRVMVAKEESDKKLNM